ncbi:Histone-fold,Protein Lines, N-terminal,Transcription factor CBF/NF-Y/archaeal histone [Cinara cedri]|uniref:Histone-fold,Protein Lines, N-terminal,Transcription factor CBF/NF-Y/archaeal histone n=1 Tax=Cinara cedri TaxID=506608 RepID=A0A5E4NRG4_9HEMI|nr:Histone-fold,Protein Lines, N-terminal,Transcription factor CBF/NF-Y/archaeal histone [Cinara cedri]
MPSKKRKYNARFPAGRIKKIMRIDDEIGKVALPVPKFVALELFVHTLLNKAGDITLQKNARTLTLTHLKQCIYSDSRLDFLKELMKNIPDLNEELNTVSSIPQPPIVLMKQFSNSESEEEEEEEEEEVSLIKRRIRGCEMTETIKTLIANGGCVCGSSGYAYRWLLSRPVDADPLSAARLLLSTCRRQAHACCPAVRRACSALVFDPAWADYLLESLSSPDRYIRYSASRAATETVWCHDGPLQVRLIDGLVLATITAMRVRETSPTSAIGVIACVLANDKDSCIRIPAVTRTSRCAGPTTDRSAAVSSDHHEIKRLLLDRLEGCWTDLVTAVIDNGENNDCKDENDNNIVTRIELIRLWKSVLSSTDHSRYYTDLPALMDRLLYRTDTDPNVWLNAVRLLSASLVHPEMTDELMAVADEVATGITRRRLLYFMCKTLTGHQAKVVLQEIVLLAMRSLRVLVTFGRVTTDQTATLVVDCLDSYVKSSTLFAVDVRFCRWLVRLMCDRDDVVVECLACTLAIVDAAPAIRPLFEPLESFAELLASVSFEPDVLLDYLISDENEFLPYLLNMLKTAARDIGQFSQCCGSDTERAMDLLIRLRLKILKLHEKNVFPYNIMPIAKLIHCCEKLYSQMQEA